ncbi:hypothetical protein [Planktothricoides raciborskii]|uniref:Glycosyltransferase RgtA/B/C/D-like domain-containing protein n=1 Tax=Planktothricoides raciborskii FACHB-1370 TaxID=2949576 RepID=A0ABR8EJ80_9CYAN|nr:hypothetical protein [Planktothricoides raciborskii]MBD2546698.1 hypothetical protein [Planktothricoides raciborskii FACHB-1370]MBD2582652.1 hypothetical protein [Planktothricoides raciborskii FACHB-1261]
MHQFLTAPIHQSTKSRTIFWFSLALTFATIYGGMVLQQAFTGEYVIQDDARQHIFWMQRFIDPGLFPNDLIADYFQTVAPWGYTNLYRLMTWVGITPILLHKLSPIILGLITTAYCFGITIELFPVPIAGFLSSLLLNHYIWMRDDVVSGTAVAFVYPFFTAFLYYLLRRNLFGSCLAIALEGIFYPQAVLISSGILILQLCHWKKWQVYLSHQRKDYLFSGICLIVALIVMLIYALKSNGYGPVITADAARQMPEFLTKGKSEFFTQEFGHFWFSGQRSGMLPRLGTTLPLIASFFLPFILLLNSKIVPLKAVTKNLGYLLQITIASLAMFFIAHLFLFRLHLPSRYTEHSLRIVTAIAAGIAIALIIDALLNWGKKPGKIAPNKPILSLILAGGLIALVVLEPTWLKRFPRTDYVVGSVPQVYEFFAQQPKDILIASVAEEVNNIPAFSQRSILIGGEGYPVPYHTGYYRQIRDRTLDLITAYYSQNLNQLEEFIQEYSIDFFLVETGSFTPDYIRQSNWMMQYQPAANQAIAQLETGSSPLLAQIGDRCTRLQVKNLKIIDANCAIAKKISFARRI